MVIREFCWQEAVHIYIIGVDKNSGQGKGYPNSDQTFQADFNELLLLLISLKLIEIPGNSHCFHSQLTRSTADHWNNWICDPMKIASTTKPYFGADKLGLRPHENTVASTIILVQHSDPYPLFKSVLTRQYLRFVWGTGGGQPPRKKI
jgi:hypothetical protein